VLDAGQPVPPLEKRREVLFSVRASARYYVPPAR
jgi:hypothetical protein